MEGSNGEAQRVILLALSLRCLDVFGEAQG